MFRQTNIVWIIFFAGLCARKQILDIFSPQKKELDDTQFSYFYYICSQLKVSFLQDKKVLFKLIGSVLSSGWAYIVLVLGFIAFVVINGSIVVGAKDDHQAATHFPQILYFAAFTLFFSFSSLISPALIFSFVSFCFRNKLKVLICFTIFTLFVHFFTYEHIYLLSDNRHYTFYIWSKIYKRHHLVKYILCPVYIYALWAILNALGDKDIIWKVLFVVCICVNLIPQQLFEFRYFIMPYLIFRLNISPKGDLLLIAEGLLYLLLNICTIYLFLAKPFQWPNNGDWQRFMW